MKSQQVLIVGKRRAISTAAKTGLITSDLNQMISLSGFWAAGWAEIWSAPETAEKWVQKSQQKRRHKNSLTRKKRKLRRNVHDFSSSFGIRFAPGGGEKKVRLKWCGWFCHIWFSINSFLFSLPKRKKKKTPLKLNIEKRLKQTDIVVSIFMVSLQLK